MKRFLGYAAILVVGTLPLAARGDSEEDAGTARVVRGRIVAIEPAMKQFTVRTAKGEEIKLTVDDQSKLELKQRASKLGDFREGMRVHVTYAPEEGKNRVVSMVQPRLTMDAIQKEVSEALSAAKSYTYQQKDEYQKKLNAALTEMDEHIDDLKAKAAQASDEAKKRYAREMDDLRRKREVLGKKLDQVKAAAPGAWDDIKSGVGAAANDLKSTIERVRSRLQEPPPPEGKKPDGERL
ncbi:MAG TPA: hypothetical protein VK395_10840 [Gemmataceae bacterium]|nr:hypothetical protein [Gemmataceae bacterium]